MLRGQRQAYEQQVRRHKESRRLQYSSPDEESGVNYDIFGKRVQERVTPGSRYPS